VTINLEGYRRAYYTKSLPVLFSSAIFFSHTTLEGIVMTMNDTQRKGLEYVHKTQGGATPFHFIDDFDPIGAALWGELLRQGWVEVRDTHIFLTPEGALQLQGPG
jgi:hypothetical protein